MRARVCATLISTRTDTLAWIPPVLFEGEPGLATFAHGRAVSGATRAGLGITVRASAFVRCTDKHGFRHRV